RGRGGRGDADRRRHRRRGGRPAGCCGRRVPRRPHRFRRPLSQPCLRLCRTPWPAVLRSSPRLQQPAGRVLPAGRLRRTARLLLAARAGAAGVCIPGRARVHVRAAVPTAVPTAAPAAVPTAVPSAVPAPVSIAVPAPAAGPTVLVPAAAVR